MKPMPQIIKTSQSNSASKDKIILLVDDNPDDVMITIRQIKNARIDNEIVVAEDGQEALEYLFSTGAFAGSDRLGKPCVVLLDLKMRRVNGFQVLETIKQDERTKDLPVVVLTMSSDAADIEESYRLGADNFLVKWASACLLSKTIKRYV